MAYILSLFLAMLNGHAQLVSHAENVNPEGLRAFAASADNGRAFAATAHMQPDNGRPFAASAHVQPDNGRAFAASTHASLGERF